jgi:hypothetical protein
LPSLRGGGNNFNYIAQHKKTRGGIEPPRQPALRFGVAPLRRRGMPAMTVKVLINNPPLLRGGRLYGNFFKQLGRGLATSPHRLIN